MSKDIKEKGKTETEIKPEVIEEEIKEEVKVEPEVEPDKAEPEVETEDKPLTLDEEIELEKAKLLDKPEDKPEAEEVVKPAKEHKPAFIKVNDEFINKLPENERKYYTALKNESVSQKALDIHVNAQKYIHDLKNKPEQITQQVKPMDDAEILKIKNDLIYREMIKDIPDFPRKALDDYEELKEFAKNLSYEDPLLVADMKSKLNSVKDNVNKWEKDYRELANSWQDRAKEQISADVNKFSEYVTSITGMKMEDLGFDPNDEQYILNNIILTNGEANKDVVLFNHNIPIIRPGSVEYVLMKKLLPSILEQAKLGAKKEMFNSKPRKANPSNSNSGGGVNETKTTSIPIKKESASLDELEIAIAAEKKKHGVIN